MLVTQPASPLVDPTRRSTPYMLTPNVCRDVGWGWEVAGRKEVSCATILKVSAYWKVQTEHKTLQINIQVLECSDTNVMPVCWPKLNASENIIRSTVHYVPRMCLKRTLFPQNACLELLKFRNKSTVVWLTNQDSTLQSEYMLCVIKLNRFIHSLIHPCLMTGPWPLPKRVLHTVRPNASSFNFQ